MVDPSQVTACLVTKGDQDISDIVSSLQEAGYAEVIVWNNQTSGYRDLCVLGRYAAIAQAQTSVVYTQDDDCIILPAGHQALWEGYEPGKIVSLMPVDHCQGQPHILVGWGSIFDQDLPAQYFAEFLLGGGNPAELLRECDLIFGGVAPHRRLDYEPQLEWHKGKSTVVRHRANAFTPDRLHHEPNHDDHRIKLLYQARRIAGLHSDPEDGVDSPNTP